MVPACPAAAPGGISAFELRQAARLLTANSLVRGLDITEIDASRDAEDQRTIRLGALLVLEAAAGHLKSIANGSDPPAPTARDSIQVQSGR